MTAARPFPAASLPMPPDTAFETERLILRPHGVGDFPESLAMWSDPVVTRFIGRRPHTEEEVWARLLRYAGLWTLLGYGYWVVREAATGRFVGEVGFADFRRDTDPPLAGRPELGWVLASWAHGKGYATEAVRGALAWGEAAWGPRETVCMIDPDNEASLKVAARCGYRETARSPYGGHAVILFARPPGG